MDTSLKDGKGIFGAGDEKVLAIVFIHLFIIFLNNFSMDVEGGQSLFARILLEE